MAADGKEVRDRLDAIANMYKFHHGKPFSLASCAHRLSTLMYSKRFFPYSIQAILAGIDEHGVVALYNYDPAGSYQRETCRAAGVAGSLIEPFLDSVFLGKNNLMVLQASQEAHLHVSKDDAIKIVKDAFSNAAERHIEIGDGLQMMIVTKEGIQEFITPLKRD